MFPACGGRILFVFCAILLLHPVSSAGDQNSRIVKTDRELLNALNDTSVFIILVEQDIKLRWSEWVEKRTQPLQIRRSVIVRSLGPSQQRRPVLDFNFLTSIIKVTGFASLTFDRLELRGVVSFIPTGMLSSNDEQSAFLMYKDCLIVRKVCGDPTNAKDLIQNFTRPREYESTRQQVAVEAQWCYEYNSTRCYQPALVATNVAARLAAGLGSTGTTEPGYAILMMNTTAVCERGLDEECVLQKGPEVCTEEANTNFTIQARRESEGTPTSSTSNAEDWVVPLAIALGTTGGVFLLGLTSWLLVLRHRRPRALMKLAPDGGDLWGGRDLAVPEDITLGLLLGSGSTGRVYQGTWQGQKVAIKIILHSVREAEKVTQELEVNMSFDHVNIVRALHIARVQHRHAKDSEGPGELMCLPSQSRTKEGSSTPSGSVPSSNQRSGNLHATNRGGMHIISFKPGTNHTPSAHPTTSSSFVHHVTDHMSSPDLETWLVLELCDRGNLSHAVARKDFMDDLGKPSMQAILLRLLDIAHGMAYVHARSICHGDLKCENVMLSSDSTDPYGVIAKIADFGLARALKAGQTHLSTQRYGTVTHMPPELLLSGQLRPACDVYSFGIMMWEMASGRRPFADVTHGEIVRMVVIDDARPNFKEFCQEEASPFQVRDGNEIGQWPGKYEPPADPFSGGASTPANVSGFLGDLDGDEGPVSGFWGEVSDKPHRSPSCGEPVGGFLSPGPREVSPLNSRPRTPDQQRSGVPRDYVRLAQDCWQRDALRRPTFDVIVKRLEAILARYKATD